MDLGRAFRRKRGDVVMIIDKTLTSRANAGDRRADDTHWWNAYRLNSTAASTIDPPRTTPSSETVSPYAVFEPRESTEA